MGMMISDLGDQLSWAPVLARWHYDQWGLLTGADSFDGYVALLTQGGGEQSSAVGSRGRLEGRAARVGEPRGLRPPAPPRTDTMACSTLRGANSTARRRRRSPRVRDPREG